MPPNCIAEAEYVNCMHGDDVHLFQSYLIEERKCLLAEAYPSWEEEEEEEEGEENPEEEEKIASDIFVRQQMNGHVIKFHTT